MRVFVYGTLKSKGKFHHMIADNGGEFLGKYRTPPKYSMYDLGPFPCVTEENKGVSVAGEIYQVSKSTIAALDSFEGVNTGLYYRKTILCGKYGSCQAYFMKETEVPISAFLVEYGDW